MKKLELGSYYWCGTHTCKVVGEVYENEKGDKLVRVISPYGYVYDDVCIDSIIRESTHQEMLSFLNGYGISDQP